MSPVHSMKEPTPTTRRDTPWFRAAGPIVECTGGAPRGAEEPCRGERTRPATRRSGWCVAEGSLILGEEVRVGSRSDNDGTSQYHQMVRVRLARRKGVREEPVLESLSSRSANSNLVDQGWSATRTHALAWATSFPVLLAGAEATVNACGVTVAMLQGHSWAPTGKWAEVVAVVWLVGWVDPVAPVGTPGSGVPTGVVGHCQFCVAGVVADVWRRMFGPSSCTISAFEAIRFRMDSAITTAICEQQPGERQRGDEN